MLRLFTGAQLHHTLDHPVVPLYPDLEEGLRTRGALPIKSGSYLHCVSRNGAFANSAKNKRRAEDWIESNVPEALVADTKRRLVVKADSPSRAWPSISELCRLLTLDEEAVEARFPRYGEKEIALFRLQCF